MKTILIVSAGIESIFGILKAKELGYYVVVSDGNPNAPGFEYADDFIIASTYDIEDTIKKAKIYNSKRKIDGVICIASDVPKTVAALSEIFKTRSISNEIAKICSDKFLMKKIFKENGISVPWFSEILSLEDLKKEISEKNSEFVLKPVDSRGARGVLRISANSDLEKSYDISKSFSQ